MTSDQYTALASAVEHGLYRGWDLVHAYTVRPRKQKLLEGLLAAIMVDLDKLITQCENPHDRC